MSLSEEQVQRYARQILLPEMGGRGQEKLLASGVNLTGRGPAQAIAASYLAAAGCSVCVPDRIVNAGELGFLFTSDDVGRPYSEALRRALQDMNPDALARSGDGCLGEVPASFFGSGPWIALGRRGDRDEVLYRAPAGCGACFTQNLSALLPPPPTAAAFLGPLAALVFQRLCLGLSDPIGRLVVEDGGSLIQLSPSPCGQCAAVG